MHCPTLSELPPPPAGKTGWPWTLESARTPATMADGSPWPRVSVMTPSFKQAGYIEETIRSVLLQGYPNLEYIIVDGGSTDGTVDIIRKYEPWLRYWVSRRDRGQTHAINKGWRKASGDVIAYINSDDCYAQGTLARAAEAFTANPGAGLIYGKATIVDEKGRPLREWEAFPFDLKSMFLGLNMVPQPSAFYTKAALDTVGYLDEQWNMIMDYEFVIRVGIRFPTVFLPITLSTFRDHSHSKTSTMPEAAIRELSRFGAAFFAREGRRPEVRAIKRVAIGKYFYLWSVLYTHRRRQNSYKALGLLLHSLMVDPRHALKLPLGTGYIVKEALFSYLSRGLARRQRSAETARPSPLLRAGYGQGQAAEGA
jgi:glycosyltransferase involved in cell wall biosynthesis